MDQGERMVGADEGSGAGGGWDGGGEGGRGDAVEGRGGGGSRERGREGGREGGGGYMHALHWKSLCGHLEAFQVPEEVGYRRAQSSVGQRAEGDTEGTRKVVENDFETEVLGGKGGRGRGGFLRGKDRRERRGEEGRRGRKALVEERTGGVLAPARGWMRTMDVVWRWMRRAGTR